MNKHDLDTQYDINSSSDDEIDFTSNDDDDFCNNN